jgi:hypothetical protein
MSVLGIGAMIHALKGGSEQSPEKYVGREIVGAALSDDVLRLKFADGVAIELFDDGQSCCESRYVTTDDDVGSLVGRRLVSISAKKGPETEGEYGDVHETMFVEVQTDGGFITLTTHNEHNGYYGGFGLTIREVEGTATLATAR